MDLAREYPSHYCLTSILADRGWLAPHGDEFVLFVNLKLTVTVNGTVSVFGFKVKRKLVKTTDCTTNGL